MLPTRIKTHLLMVFGWVMLAIGVLFILLPGPAILFIPVGLGILSLEYAFAKRWLRKYQRYSSDAARRMDDWFTRERFKRIFRRG
ncbi:PGPGW domain-containing protein [Thalassotalea sp. PS06]|uniref:PGPGW domain-containing protein n=1 Tax=Thalassotalea sp. PS06 TaxID=2594005 RepID=UPI0021B0D99F|nr:PGPGW domain-containing protein [Thalassotalea sp. PS06]